jgi:hypothetical protein
MRARGVATCTSRMGRVRSTGDNSAMALRRARGAILRLVRRRAAAMTIGLALVVPAAWVEFSGRYDAWWVTGLALIAGATGLAIFWTGLTGPSPDWIE